MRHELFNGTEFYGFSSYKSRFLKLMYLYREMFKKKISKVENEIFGKRIGNTTYKVNVIFSKNETESLEEKLMHLVNVDIESKISERRAYE